jgi:hypothetical protein
MGARARFNTQYKPWWLVEGDHDDSNLSGLGIDCSNLGDFLAMGIEKSGTLASGGTA